MTENKSMELAQNIGNYINVGKKTLKYNAKGKAPFEIEINENVPFNIIETSIKIVVDMITDKCFERNGSDFDYELMDEFLPYLFISLFTNIPVPYIESEDENEERVVDYEMCFQIYTALDLRYRTFEVSPIVAEYMGIVEKNIWRRLEFAKQKVLRDKEYAALSEFYEILDDLSDVVKKQEEITPEKIDEFVSSFNELSETLVSENKIETTENSNNVLNLVEDKADKE